MTHSSNSISVSVIIPCYGDLPHLLRALNSVSVQSLLPSEVILVNDSAGSVGNLVLVEMLKRQWPFSLRCINLNKNIGAGPARNIGWNMATGVYIAFLDADDVWHPDKLAIQISFMEDNPHIGLTGHGHQVLRSNDDVLVVDKFTLSYCEVSLLQMLIKNPFITPSVVIRKSLGLRFNQHQRYSEDYRLWLEAICSGYRVAKLTDSLAAIYKPLISDRGLSSNLLLMEYGELQAYSAVSLSSIRLYPLLLILIPYSLVKFLRRIVIRIFFNLRTLGAP